MIARNSSLLILLGGLLALLLMWYLSVLFVRRDTHMRQVRGEIRELDRRLWVGIATGLPLFGFALYLFMQILRRYMTPPPPVESPRDMSVTAVRAKAFKEPVDKSLAKEGPTEPQGAVKRGYAASWPVNGKEHKAGANGAQVEKTPITIAAPYRAARARYALVVLQGPDTGKVFALHPLPQRMGRGMDVQISLDADLNVSRQHAEIYEWNGMLRIRDLGSAHGTLINSIPVTDQALSPGDHIAVGGTVFILQEQT